VFSFDYTWGWALLFLLFNLAEVGSFRNEQLCSPMEQVSEAATRSALFAQSGLRNMSELAIHYLNDAALMV
jgi:hypothetical protein